MTEWLLTGAWEKEIQMAPWNRQLSTSFPGQKRYRHLKLKNGAFEDSRVAQHHIAD